MLGAVNALSPRRGVFYALLLWRDQPLTLPRLLHVKAQFFNTSKALPTGHFL